MKGNGKMRLSPSLLLCVSLLAEWGCALTVTDTGQYCKGVVLPASVGVGVEGRYDYFRDVYSRQMKDLERYIGNGDYGGNRYWIISYWLLTDPLFIITLISIIIIACMIIITFIKIISLCTCCKKNKGNEQDDGPLGTEENAINNGTVEKFEEIRAESLERPNGKDKALQRHYTMTPHIAKDIQHMKMLRRQFMEIIKPIHRVAGRIVCLLVLIAIPVCGFYIYQSMKVIKNIDIFVCQFSKLIVDIRMGTSSTAADGYTYLDFAGLTKLRDLSTKLPPIISLLSASPPSSEAQSIKSAAQNLQSQSYGTLSSNLKSAHAKLPTQPIGEDYEYIGADDATRIVSPGFKYLISTIYPNQVSPETQQLISSSSLLSSTGLFFSTVYAQDRVDSIRRNINAIILTVDNDILGVADGIFNIGYGKSNGVIRVGRVVSIVGIAVVGVMLLVCMPSIGLTVCFAIKAHPSQSAHSSHSKYIPSPADSPKHSAEQSPEGKAHNNTNNNKSTGGQRNRGHHRNAHSLSQTSGGFGLLANQTVMQLRIEGISRNRTPIDSDRGGDALGRRANSPSKILRTQSFLEKENVYKGMCSEVSKIMREIGPPEPSEAAIPDSNRPHHAAYELPLNIPHPSKSFEHNRHHSSSAGPSARSNPTMDRLQIAATRREYQLQQMHRDIESLQTADRIRDNRKEQLRLQLLIGEIERSKADKIFREKELAQALKKKQKGGEMINEEERWRKIEEKSIKELRKERKGSPTNNHGEKSNRDINTRSGTAGKSGSLKKRRSNRNSEPHCNMCKNIFGRIQRIFSVRKYHQNLYIFLAILSIIAFLIFLWLNTLTLIQGRFYTAAWCKGIQGILMEDQFTQNLDPQQRWLSKNTQNLVSECIGPKPSGKGVRVAWDGYGPDANTELWNLVDALAGLSVYNKLSDSLKSAPSTKTAATLKATSYLNDLLLLTTSDSTGNNSFDIDSAISRFNGYKCAQDTFAYATKCPANYAESSSSSTNDKEVLNQNYCISAAKLPSSCFSQRYSQTPPTAQCTGVLTAEGQKLLTKTCSMIKDYQGKLQKLNTKQQDVFNAQDAVRTSLSSNAANLKSMLATPTVGAFAKESAVVLKSDGLTYCRFIRSDVLALESTLCENVHTPLRYLVWASFGLTFLTLIILTLLMLVCLSNSSLKAVH